MEPFSSRLAVSGGGAAGAPDFRLAVLNPDGRDREQDFSAGAGGPDDVGAPHPPINYHAYAACTGGSFHAKTALALATGRPVLLLLRRSLGDGWRALETLKAAGRTVVVTFKEAGALQVAARLTRAGDIDMLGRIVAAADGCLAPTPSLEAFFRAVGHPAGGADPGMKRAVAFVPTPYPVEDARWDFSAPASERHGIFIGTREWDIPARQHLAALWAARRLHALTGERVSVINADGRAGAKRLTALGFSADPSAALRVVAGPLPYAGYLREMARHKLVFQLDRGGVPGQVAGDALLCRVPCVGGDGAVERIAFPGLSGHGRTPGELADLAETLLRDAARCAQASAGAHEIARERLSFRAVAGQLRDLFERTLR